MREFSPFEKKVIEYITSKECLRAPYSVTKIMESFFGNKIRIEINNNNVTIGVAALSDNETYNPNFYRELIEFIYLFDYLHKNQFVFLMKVTHDRMVTYQNTENTETTFIENIEIDNETQQLLKTLLKSLVFASQPLIYLRKNNFKTDEQKRDRISKISVWTAIIIGVVTIVIGIWTAITSDSVKLEEIDDIKQEIRDSKTAIPAVIETKITNDTIKVDVVKPTPIKGNSNAPTK